MEKILSSIAQKIEKNPELRQAYTRACNGTVDNSTASQIAMLYKQLLELTQAAEMPKIRHS